ncbi:hypothetical protein [Mesorhizobium sp. LjNodule214]|uniref:hypothetical protein n=1 Tax=Mesorhizobium sp. LjNodule214 TaxID=3342252 RepID=UPI003ED173B1
MKPAIEQIDPILCEDGQTIHLWGYDAADAVYFQSITWPVQIDAAAFEAGLSEWRAMHDPSKWRPSCP